MQVGNPQIIATSAGGAGGGGGVPGGITGTLQYNGGSIFAGVVGSVVGTNGQITLAANADVSTLEIIQNGTNSPGFIAHDTAGDSIQFITSPAATVLAIFDTAGDGVSFAIVPGTNVDFAMVDAAGGSIDLVTTLGTTAFVLTDSTNATLTISPSLVGFFSATPVGKQTVTGVKLPADAALASLLAALVALGLIVDSTS